jgi:uncharacterized protein YegL
MSIFSSIKRFFWDAPTKSVSRIYILVDESGSMLSKTAIVVNGFNEFIKRQKEIAVANDECTVSTYFFNKHIKTIYEDVPIADVKQLEWYQYVASSSTALRDATCHVFNKVLETADNTDRTIILILTDGQENSSIHTTPEQLKELQEQVQKVAEIVYIGSNQDAVANGQVIGATKETTLSYVDDNLHEAIFCMGSAVSRARSSGNRVAFTQLERSASSGRSS